MSVAVLLEQLADIVGSAYLLTEARETAPYLTDWRGRYTGQALCVVKPANTEQAARVVAACSAAGVAIVGQGGNTGLVGGGTPAGYPGGEVVVSLRRMNRIRAIDLDNNTMTVDAGCVLQQVQEAAVAAERLFPLSLAAEGSATIGGNLSTNAGGVQVLRYGNMRDLTLGLEVVLADGRIWNGLRGLRKDNTGYDLKQLFIGAEGTLGLITAAVIKLFPLPRQKATAWIAVRNPEAALGLLNAMRQTNGEQLNAFELINRTALELVLKHVPGMRNPLSDVHAWQILIEVCETSTAHTATTDLKRCLESVLGAQNEAGLLDAVVAQTQTQAEMLWKLRENISEAQRIDGISIKHDVSLPISKISEFILRAELELQKAFPGLRTVCFGHLGDGNLHFNLSKAALHENSSFIAATEAVNQIVHDLVHDLSGSISAEHGLGQLKRTEILRYKSSVEIELMAAIKNAIDPKGLMNPGKVI